MTTVDVIRTCTTHNLVRARSTHVPKTGWSDKKVDRRVTNVQGRTDFACFGPKTILSRVIGCERVNALTFPRLLRLVAELS